MKRRLHLFLFIASFMLVSCSTEIEKYNNTTPKFDLFSYFTGDTRAWGMVQDFTGMQTRRFVVEITGTVDGDTLVLDELFDYDDGERDTRRWEITKQSDGSYIGTAGDIIGEAIGVEKGNALHWKYDLELLVDGDPIVVHFDDWLYRQDESHVFNVTQIKKYGVNVGKVTLFFQK
ncbi:DUF3833 domain-containing protein [Vibrio sp. RC27]